MEEFSQNIEGEMNIPSNTYLKTHVVVSIDLLYYLHPNGRFNPFGNTWLLATLDWRSHLLSSELPRGERNQDESGSKVGQRLSLVGVAHWTNSLLVQVCDPVDGWRRETVTQSSTSANNSGKNYFPTNALISRESMYTCNYNKQLNVWRFAVVSFPWKSNAPIISISYFLIRSCQYEMAVFQSKFHSRILPKFILPCYYCYEHAVP
jgi:hypothetical protein